MPVCRQNNYIILFWGMFLAERIKGFFGGGILCYLLFSVVSEFGADFFISVVLNVLCSFSSISTITSSSLVMIGYVREIRHMYQLLCLL